ncbi:MAG: putative glycine betaine transport system integral rane protein [Marmoricola sp.]|nr:putative glycine betaine transport system integral rane protein [Marmoricola sp.]
MATTTTAPPPAAPEQGGSKEEQPYVAPQRRRRTGLLVLGILVVWVVLYAVLKGQDTRSLGIQDTTGFHDWLNRVRDWVQLHGPDNWFFGGVLGFIGDTFNSVFTFLQKLVSVPAFPRPVPQVGWLGVVAIAAWISWAVAGLRSMLLVVVSMLFFGIFDLWQDSLDLLLVTLLAVAVCFVVGLPLGIAMARSRRVSAVVTPFLDIAQTLPPFAYLAPVALGFGIGPTTGIVLTVIYALPPLVRISEHGIRSVPETTVEAARSMGLTGRQMLRQVELPMARRTIVVGINQSMMAALSMATIASLVNSPGLGKPVNAALQVQNIGAAAVAGILIVLMAIMLDRTTTAASERSESTGRSGIASVSGPGVMLKGVLIEKLPRWASEDAGRGVRRPRLTSAGRWLVRAVWLVPVLVAVYLSRSQIDLAKFPDRTVWPFLKPIDGTTATKLVNDFSTWFIDLVDTFTLALKNDVTDWVVDPVQNLLADSPWWLVGVVILALAYVLGGWRPAVTTVVCLAVIFAVGLWNDTMQTLAMTLIATLLVMVVAVVLGVAMGRNRRADTVIRPFLDAFQTIPPFVYLVPALALFGVGRFTAIMAALAYAVPIATKLVADGIRGVAPTTVEAARASGSTTWQMITKVQLPMAREALVLATNQGLLYVLSMVVIGGLVGGGSLGYLVVSGFAQDQLFGKGLAAGIAITALGVMLDRIARHAAARSGR